MKDERVLVVDDDDEIRALLRFQLARQDGAKWVGEAANGVEAIEKAAELKPGIVILDIEMPEMTGLDALPRIIEVSPGVKVAMFSSVNPAREREAMALGASAYFHKGEHVGTVVANAVALSDN